MISLEPFIDIGRPCLQGAIDFTSKSTGIQLVLDRLVEAFAPAVGLRRLGWRARGFHVLPLPIELILMMRPIAAILTPPIGEDCESRNPWLFEPRQHAVVEPIGGANRRRAIIPFHRGHFAGGSDKRWRIEAAHAFDRAHTVRTCAPR